MLEVISDQEKMLYMPLFQMSERRSFNPKLDYQDQMTILGNSYAGNQIDFSKVN